ncbi:MAG: hypothetical protein KAI70_02680 [Candidatus Omnitrophica bacterium]|nr:hypothetical protein [Candidatus Omnitrophota bacterium]
MFVVHDHRIPKEYMDALRIKFPKILFLPFYGISNNVPVYNSILSHPDIYIFQLNRKTVIHAPGISEIFLKYFKKYNVTLIQGDNDPFGKYPDTAGYNAVCLKGVLFHNFEYTDPVIIRTAKQKGFKLVNINQGYARCATFIISENAVITSDKGMATVFKNNGIDVLTVSSKSIALPGEKYGFIGGASGRLNDDKVFILGDMTLHVEYFEISRFLIKHQVECVSLKGLSLYDAGGFMVF